MTKSKNTRLPKKNPWLNHFEQRIRDTCYTYEPAKEYVKKRKDAKRLRSLIDKWLAEPEWVCDLMEGPTYQVKQECWSRISPADAPFPFDTAGNTDNSYFFLAYRTLSELFTADQMKLDDVKACILGRTAYFVLQLERIYATENTTVMHFFSDRVFERHAQSASANTITQNRYVVLADPAGHREGHAMISCSNKSLPQARKRALELAKKFDIRFLVARVVGVIDVH